MSSLLLPLFIQVFGTFILLYYMGFLRVKAIATKEISIRQIALGQQVWPEFVQRVSNCFHNQLQLPPLFYLAVVLCLQFHLTQDVFVWLSWFFVFGRFGHALVEIRSNHVPTRFRWFLFSATTLLSIWICLFYFILVSNR